MRYRTFWVARHVMPDDRLAYGNIDTEPDDAARITMGVRHDRIHPELMRELSQFTRGFEEVEMLELDPDHSVDQPETQVQFRQADARFVGDRLLLAVPAGEGMCIELLLREDLITPELIAELNQVMPTVAGLLVPNVHAEA